MLDPNDPLVKTAVLGKQVEDFFKSDLGDYLLAKIEEETDLAVEKLKNTAPWRTRRIRELQNQIKVVESVRNWLADAIISGQQATEVIEEEHG